MPAVMAQVSAVAMQYIDAAMVGSLGADATAAIGLVSSTTWLFGGLCIAAATGFSVQAAQLIGGNRDGEAKQVLRQAVCATFLFGMLLLAVGLSISQGLPVWLGGEASVCAEASRYFRIYACALPAAQLRQTAGSMLQCSGDMKVPGRLNMMMCALDVVFNSLLIFPSRQVVLFDHKVWIAGAGLGVAGAALGTALSEVITAACMLYAVLFRSVHLRLERGNQGLRGFRPDAKRLHTALRLAVPMGMEHVILCGAQIAGTRIVAPLGTVAVAANSLAVTAESLCYMPGKAAACQTLCRAFCGAGRYGNGLYGRADVFMRAVYVCNAYARSGNPRAWGEGAAH